MGKSAGLVVLVGLLVGAGSARQAGTHEDARRLVARAIRAAGGEDRLARYGARTWKEKAVYHGADGDERYEASYSAEWPDKLRVDIGDFIMVLNGDKGWVKTQGETREMSREEMEEHREGTYSAWVLSLVPLGRADFRLSLLGQRLVDGRPADGIKISRQGHFDVNMYFDRDTGLLAMTETRFREARSGREVKSETVFSIYKEVSGIKTPTAVSITRDGRLAVEASIETTYVERLGERVFAKP